MAASFCGYVIKVRDLDICRAFYRDILQLGSPIADSNFRVEFNMGKDTKLVLCKARDEETLGGSVRAAVWIAPENPALQIDVLASCGYMPVEDELNLLYPGIKCFHDPENNLIYFIVK